MRFKNVGLAPIRSAEENVLSRTKINSAGQRFIRVRKAAIVGGTGQHKLTASVIMIHRVLNFTNQNRRFLDFVKDKTAAAVLTDQKAGIL